MRKPGIKDFKYFVGIRSLADFQKMVAAGATRIGTSRGVKILQEAADQKPATTADAD